METSLISTNFTCQCNTGWTGSECKVCDDEFSFVDDYCAPSVCVEEGVLCGGNGVCGSSFNI